MTNTAYVFPAGTRCTPQDQTAWTILDDRRALPAGMAAHPSHAEEGAGTGAQRAAMLFYRRIELPAGPTPAAAPPDPPLLASDLFPKLPVVAGGRLAVPPDAARLSPLTVWIRNSSPFTMELKAVHKSPTTGKLALQSGRPLAVRLPAPFDGAGGGAGGLPREGVHAETAYAGDYFCLTPTKDSLPFALGQQPVLQVLPLTTQWVDVGFDLDAEQRRVTYEVLASRPSWAPRSSGLQTGRE